MATVTQNPPQTPIPTGGEAASAQPTQALLFTEASYRVPRKETDLQATGLEFGSTFSGEVQANGFLDALNVYITASGGSGSTTAAVAAPKAPFSVIQTIQLFSPGGTKPLLTLSGYELYLANLLGGIDAGKITSLPSYQGVDSNGNFQFRIKIPVSISKRTALGALENMNSGSKFELSIVFAPASAVYSTAPDPTLPTLSVTTWSENWVQPPAKNEVTGVPQETAPPLLGLTSYWTSWKSGVLGAGEQEFYPNRVGQVIRNWILVTEVSGVPTNVLSGVLRFTITNTEYKNIDNTFTLDEMYEVYDANLPAGVYPIPLTTDFDGHAGFELREQWVPTTTATKLQFAGNFTQECQVTVITNDIAVPAGDDYLTPIRF
jgi:hypothetical protein